MENKPKIWGRDVAVYDTQADFPDPPTGDDDVAVLVCMPIGRTHFKDNVTANCEKCGIAIMHRPHVPKGCVKMCHRCALEGMRKAEAGGDEIKVFATKKTMAEVEDYIRSQKK